MRLGRRTCSLQCLALGDSRSVVCDRASSCFSTTIATTSPAGLRRSYFSLRRGVPLITRNTQYPIIKNSLRKTLEAQRTVNRSRLIRKIYDKDKGITDDKRSNNAADDKSISIRIKKFKWFEKRTDKAKSIFKRIKKVKISTKYQSRPLPAGEEPAPVRLPWVLPLENGRAQQTPWLGLIQQPSKQKGDAMSILSNELLGLTTFLKPSSTEQAAVSHIIDDISSKLQSIVPSPPQLIGSRYSQLATSTSVIDLMILVGDYRTPNFPTKEKPPKITPQMTYTYLNILTEARDVLKNDYFYRDDQIIFQKSSSLVLFHTVSGLPVRLVCRSHAPKLEEFIRESLPDLPSLLPLYMVIKVLLESKSLFGWEARSLSSNGLLLLIMSFLKQQKIGFTSKSLGEQLLSLLHTYGKEINLTTTGISAHPAQFFQISSIRQHERTLRESHMKYPDFLIGQRAIMNYKIHARHRGNTGVAAHLCIQDPTNYLVDAGHRCFKAAMLQETFSWFYDELMVALKRRDDDRGILGQVLRADFDELVRRKKMLELLGL